MAEVKVTGWLVMEPTWFDDTNRVTEAKFAKVTTRAPKLTDDQRAVRVTLKVPSSVWEPVARINVQVPESAVVEPEVTFG